MCEMTKIPKIHYYNRVKVVIIQNEVVWNQIYQKHRAVIFAMQGIFASIAKISLASEIAKMENFARNSDFH